MAFRPLPLRALSCACSASPRVSVHSFGGPVLFAFPAAFLELSALREVSPLPLAALPFRNMHAHPFPALFLVLLRWTRPAANLCFVFILETVQAVQPITYSATLPRQFIICFMDLETVRSPCSRKGVADAERNPAGLTGGAALLRPRISVPVGSAGFVLLRSCASLPRGKAEPGLPTPPRQHRPQRQPQ